jgi:hypothetical protein
MTSYTRKTIVIAMIAAMAIPSLATASRFRGADAGTGIYMVDTDGDGIGDTRPERGTGMGAGAENFVDLDNDGVCDTYAEGGEQLLDGSQADIALCVLFVPGQSHNRFDPAVLCSKADI